MSIDTYLDGFNDVAITDDYSVTIIVMAVVVVVMMIIMMICIIMKQIIEVKLSLCLTRHHAIKTNWGVEV
jgi:hypothetical protein